eukprot:TRINITY_DN23448_c0_g1_i2.p2 TRINITY_DN23448_c0_g1~~TRINITY_DN23448_c0_g1_i2.p2  ORF type:complete len:247 (-),score=70.63 TRINITY_DN23448_c0_g1_i2:51-713(-)
MAYEAKVMSYNPAKGYGFIEWTHSEKGGMFFNAKHCVGGYPKPGETVRFDVEDSFLKPGYKQAAHVSGGSLDIKFYPSKAKDKDDGCRPLFYEMRKMMIMMMTKMEGLMKSFEKNHVLGQTYDDSKTYVENGIREEIENNVHNMTEKLDMINKGMGKAKGENDKDKAHEKPGVQDDGENKPFDVGCDETKMLENTPGVPFLKDEDFKREMCRELAKLGIT